MPNLVVYAVHAGFRLTYMWSVICWQYCLSLVADVTGGAALSGGQFEVGATRCLTGGTALSGGPFEVCATRC
jgi:hypothetical protein